MKLPTILIVIACVLALIGGIAVLFTKSRTTVLESIVDIQALWNDEELFVVVQKQVAIRRTNRLLQKVSEVIGASLSKPHLPPQDVIVFRIADGQLQEFTQRALGAVGSAFVLKGTLHFLRGSDPADYPFVLRLSGTNFVRLDKPEAEIVVNSFQTERELLDLEGWHKHDLYFTSASTEYSVETKHQTLKLVLSKSRQSGIAQLDLVDVRGQSTNTLIRASTRYHEPGPELLRQVNFN